MNILARTPIIRRLINKNIRSRIRLINKGHKNLKEQNRLELPMQLRDCLAKTRLNSVKVSCADAVLILSCQLVNF